MVLVGAGVGREAVLSRRYVRLGGAEYNGFHFGDVGSYGAGHGGELFCEVDYLKRPIAPVRPVIHNRKTAHLTAVRDDIVLQGGVAAVGVAEGGAGFDLVDVEAAVVALADNVGQHQHVVVLEAGLEEHDAVAVVQQLRRARGVGVDITFQLGTDIDAVGVLRLEGVLEVAPGVEAAHLLACVACQAWLVHIEPQRPLALQAADVFAFAQ